MTDTSFEKMLHDTFADAELPESLSEKNVLAALQNVEPVRTVYGIKRYIAAAAAVVVLIGLSSVLLSSGLFSRKGGTGLYAPASADEFVEYSEASPAPSPEPNLVTNGSVPADEPKEAFSGSDSSDSAVYSASQDGLRYDEEIIIQKGTSIDVELAFEFGNGTEICYYDAAGSSTENPCCSVTVSDGTCKINGIAVGETIIEFSNGTDTCTIKVTVSEGSF